MMRRSNFNKIITVLKFTIILFLDIIEWWIIFICFVVCLWYLHLFFHVISFGFDLFIFLALIFIIYSVLLPLKNVYFFVSWAKRIFYLVGDKFIGENYWTTRCYSFYDILCLLLLFPVSLFLCELFYWLLFLLLLKVVLGWSYFSVSP